MKDRVKGGAIEQARVLTDRGHRTSMAHKVFNGANLTRHLQGGATTPIFVLNDNDSVDRGGQYHLKGGPAQPMIVQPSGRIKGGVARAVYPVDVDGNYDYGFPRSDYMARVLSVERDSLIGYWPQDELVGAVSHDASPEQNDGAYTGVTLGQPGIGDGLTVPFFDGVNDYNNVFSAGLAADVNKDELTIGIWGRVNAVGDWTDAVTREIFRLRFTGGSGYLRAYKSGAAGQIVIVRYEGPVGGGSQTITWATGSPTDFFSMFVVQSVAGNYLRAFDNDGVQIGVDQVGLLTYEGAALDQMWLGASSGAPGIPWHGWLAPTLFYRALLSQPQVAYLGVI